ncbi:TPA: DUF3150 domain-containing protein [Vibrio cholerae]
MSLPTNNTSAIDHATAATQELLNNHKQLKEGCVIVGYEMRNWSGKKTFSEGKVTARDSGGKTVELPDDLVSPGRKSLLDTKTHLSFCNKFASRFGRLFNKFGVRFMGNHLLADSALIELLKEAEPMVEEYEQEVDNFCSKYEQLISDWCQMHPGLESVIRDGYMTVEEVRARFRLRIYKPVRFTPRVEEDLADIVGEAAAQLFEDIAKEAQQLLKDSLTIKEGTAKGSRKEECTQDIKRPLRRLRDKVFSLYMLDPVFEGVVDMFDDLLDKALPNTGKIRGTHFSNLMAHVMMMTDSHKLKLHASGINQIAAKVAEVESEQEEEEQATTAADNAPQVDTGIDDVEAELLRQLEIVRRNKAANAQTPVVKAPVVEKPQEVQSQPVVKQQPVVDTQPVVAEQPVVEQQPTVDQVPAEMPAPMVEIPVAMEEPLQVEQADASFDDVVLAEDGITVDLDALDSFETVTPKTPIVEAHQVTTSGFFF